jgi:formate hydrogenlyase transcriptional activator
MRRSKESTVEFVYRHERLLNAPCWYLLQGKQAANVGDDSGAFESSRQDQGSPISADVLREFFAAPNIGFAVLDRQSRYVAVNGALAAINGLPSEAHTGRTPGDVLGVTGEELEPVLQRVFETGAPCSFEISGRLAARSEPGCYAVSYFPIRDSRNRVHQVGAVVVEVTEQRRSTENGSIKSQSGEQGLEALLEFSGRMMSTLEEHELLAAISKLVSKVVPHDFSSIALYDPGIHRLRIHALNNLLGQELDSEDIIVPDIKTAYGPTFLHGEVRIHNRDSLQVSDCPLLRRLMQGGIQSFCLVPLISRKGTLGTLNLGRKEDNAFGPHNISFLQQVAAQVTIALDNASAYREIRELTQKLYKEKLYLQDEVHSVHEFEDIIGESPVLQRVLAQVQTVAQSEATVLVLGETGTGKELIARAIHRLSPRKEFNFIKLNCAAIPTGLLESELFGHEKGAFTGAISQKIGRLELADKGTLFLDEVGEIPLELQPKLLRVLQDQEFERLGGTRTIKVDIRVISATNRDLAKSVNTHEFRSDLYYRLHVFPVRLPALRERAKDIPLLVRYFVQKFAKRMKKQIDSVPEEAMRVLQSWIWPGNVRELENVIERSVILTQGNTLTVPLAELRMENDTYPVEATLEALERKHIVRVLRETGGVIAGMNGAAARLGMKRTTLQSRMQKMGITREEYQN